MNLSSIRQEFPILQRRINENTLIYLDNAATTQKPKEVIEAIDRYYRKYNANVHRGIHTLSQEATQLMEDARDKLQQYFNAKHREEIIFTKGTTESINLVANSLTSKLQKGDEIIISALEHHSNIVPWQMLCERTEAVLKVIPFDHDKGLDLDAFDQLLNPKTRLVSVGHVSNALGIINPVTQIIEKAHQNGAWVFLDGAQSAPHLEVDLQQLDTDFYACSAHKMYGPTGVGMLYGKKEILETLPPFLGGGEMIETVTFKKTTYADLPFKFEAGTPNIAGNFAYGAAIDFIKKVGSKAMHQYETELLSYCQSNLSEIEEVETYAENLPKAGAISFNLKNQEIHPSDVGFILDKQGIAVRTGHHCAQPIMEQLGIKGTIRASFAVYNTQEEVDRFITALKKSIVLLG